VVLHPVKFEKVDASLTHLFLRKKVTLVFFVVDLEQIPVDFRDLAKRNDLTVVGGLHIGEEVLSLRQNLRLKLSF
jgi:hypothetical protein